MNKCTILISLKQAIIDLWFTFAYLHSSMNDFNLFIFSARMKILSCSESSAFKSLKLSHEDFFSLDIFEICVDKT